jgi:hypothetical protein
MKSLKFTFLPVATFFMLLVFACSLSAQIQFEGLYSEGEGGAAWNADGTGPEPYGNGHSDIFYYVASRDYVDPTCSSGAHMLDILDGFPCFEQALLNYGFTSEQVTVKIALASMGEDLAGIDWFNIGNTSFSNFYPVKCIFELDGEPLVEAIGNYAVYISGPVIQEFESSYLKVNNISGLSTEPVRCVAAAFMSDMGAEELKFGMEVTNAAPLTGNGRSGGYFNTFTTLEKGLPAFPFQGLLADNEGTAGWNADGTGPEPYGNGHGDVVYYTASVDYDGINPSPAACLAHGLAGADGFLNTLLQLQYRGYEIGDLKLKMGLCSLGPDVYGEDWGYENGLQWLNEYNNKFTFEINGEPILEVLMDTNKMIFINPGTVTWSAKASVGRVYNISENASQSAQFVAQSFLKDLGSHYLITDVSNMTYAGTFSGNGRSGVYYELLDAGIKGVHEQATFIPEGTLSGVWTTANSPYFIDGHQSIENGQTLTIEPGVEVKIRGPYHFSVQGTVIADGTADENIIFTRSNPNLWWDGFDYNYTPITNDSSSFQHCVFGYSRALGYYPYNSGGVFAVREFNKLFINQSTFHSNDASRLSGGFWGGGGAIALWSASPVIRNSKFYDNHANYGGAIFCYLLSSPEISRNLFYNNSSTGDGGALQIWHSSPIVVNNTISLNNANFSGGAADIYDDSNPVFINNIFWENTANTGNQISITSDNCNVDITYNDIEGGLAGIVPNGIGTGVYENNIDADPHFMDVVSFNFLLDSLAPSPCIDAGDPSTPADPDGSPADMGCYYQAYTVGIENTRLEIFAEIYPNPFTDNLHIGFSLSEKAAVSLSIYNSVGALVAETDYGILQPGNFDKILHLTGLNEGIYFIKVRINDRLFTGKAVRIN